MDEDNGFDMDDYDPDDEQINSFNNFDFLKPSAQVLNDSPGLACELKLYEARYNYKGERRPLQTGKHKDQEVEHHRDHTSALVFTRWYNWELEIEITELKIRSPYLKQALKEVIKEYPEVNIQTGHIIIKGLPKCLFHYADELQAYGMALDPDSNDAFAHLLLLLKHMWEQLQEQLISYNNLMQPALLGLDVPPGLEFVNLWMAYRPGDDMYIMIKGHHRIVKLKMMYLGGTTCNVRFSYIADDGERVGYISESCAIEKYDGFRSLLNLKVFPLRYHPNAEMIKTQAILRGRKMMALRGVHYRMYSGSTESFGTNLRRTNIKSRIMIDAESFVKVNRIEVFETDDDGDRIKVNRNPAVILDEFAKRLPMFEGSEIYDLQDEHFKICHHRVPGFLLADKQWCWFDIDNILDVEFNTKAFERLLLPQEQKDMIYSLVEVHANSLLSFDDVIKGKGKGMVFLLHGIPGVGKTLTAESVADQTKRPLYTISCGELGVVLKSVETNLQAALDLATTWNAIVLMDEADVFLEQRSMNDLDRNSLVSIFLRLLEYYKGILILTTNRIESFDKAFKSRIHLAIKYQALTPEYRANLWNYFITSTTTQNTGASQYPWLTDKYVYEIGKEDLDGRQIKNIVRTAHALAVSANVQLSPKHIESALKAMKLFESDFADSHERPADEPQNKRRRIH